ncbi:MAG: MATE family efflux transporter [Lachnospiraceae bacterium]|nr:MATE family efflux transporter [Lachnospiraceae bacterium]
MSEEKEIKKTVTEKDNGSRKAAAASPLETEKISRLLVSFCIPALASSLVTSVYNIVDQLFIGNLLGVAGNAATNVVFPAVTLISALSLMCGVGSSNSMNIHRGRGDTKTAAKCVGGGFGMMILFGLAVMIPMLLATRPILTLFGCTESVMPYALDYARIIALSFVFSMISAAGTFLVRADGAPKFALYCIAVGSLSNVFMDWIFIYVFGWGIKGAAWATFLAQAISTAMVLWYMTKRFRSFTLSAEDFRPDLQIYGRLAAIGFGPAFNFGTQAIVQIFINNALRKYGAQSVYGSDVCLAIAGIAGKVNTFASGVVVGLTNGLQPISSYNFGRKNYKRVAEAGKKVVGLVLAIGFVIFLCYQIFPVQITSLFGEGDELYFEFAAKYFRIFYLLIMLFGLQSSVAGFFSSQGKVKQSITISLVRQVIFFPPLLIILPKFFGLTGVLVSGPLSDLAMAVVAGTLFIRELKKLES